MFHSRAWPQRITNRDVAICGDGASAVALAHALAKSAQRPISIAILGRGKMVGEGIAYATPHSFHLLNTPAERMSADASDPEQFARWLSESEPQVSAPFVPRSLYGRYLGDLAKRIPATSGGRVQLDVVRTEVKGLIRNGRSWIVAHSSGSVKAQIVVLATGTDMPTPVESHYPDEVRHDIVDDPWSNFQIARDRRVLILGSALTAMDTLLSLADRGHGAPIYVLSRHGLLPQPHVDCIPHVSTSLQNTQSASALLKAMRTCIGASPEPQRWQGFMDAMRPSWQAIWRTLPVAEKRRFLRHGATLWNLHRHRIAPEAHARIQAMLATNVTVLRGRLLGLTPTSSGLIAEIGTARKAASFAVDRVINCTGPNCDPEKTHDPFIQNIVESRFARTSASGTGLDVDDANRVVARDGTVPLSLYAMGSLTKGHWWEITSMPEIARQAAEIATAILRQCNADRKSIAQKIWQPG